MRKLKRFSLMASANWVASKQSEISAIPDHEFVTLPASVQKVQLCMSVYSLRFVRVFMLYMQTIFVGLVKEVHGVGKRFRRESMDSSE